MLDREEFDTLQYLLPEEIIEEITQLRKNIKIFRERLSEWKRKPEGVTAAVSNSYILLIEDQIQFMKRMLSIGPYNEALRLSSIKSIKRYEKQFWSLAHRLENEVSINDNGDEYV